MRKENKNKKGITLIGLAITIIVLLILAGVTISVLVDDTGVIGKAKDATEETRKASAIEEVSLAWTSATSEYLNAWTVNQAKEKSEFRTAENLSKYLKGKGVVSAVLDNGDGTHKVTYISDEDDMVYTVILNEKGVGKIEGEPIHRSKWKENSKTLAQKITVANYGDRVTNYIAANGYNNWKIFYSNGSNVFLIASDYVPKEYVATGLTEMTPVGEKTYFYSVCWNSPTTMQTIEENLLRLFRAGATAGYSLNSSYKNSICVSTLLNPSNWVNFKDTTTGFGENVIGGPTVGMWMASWNEKGQLYNTVATTKYVESKTQSGEYGYYVGPISTEDLSTNASANDSIGGFAYTVGKDTEGYNDTLYFPHQSALSGCNGYWLSSPAASYDTNLLRVNYTGRISHYYYTDGGTGVRPVVCLSSEVLGEPADNGGWILSK